LALAHCVSAAPLVRELVVEKPYLRFLVDNRYNAPKVRVIASEGDKVLRVFSLPIAANGEGDWLPTEDVREWMGRKITLRINKPPQEGVPYFDNVSQCDTPFIPKAAAAQRLQFHFTPPSGYMNDPNGLVWRNGEWVMMFQHAPFAVRNPWEGTQVWGHAVSRNLVDWEYLGTAARPYPDQTALISGSGVVDTDNTAGFGSGAHVLCVVGKATKGYGLLLFHSTDGRDYRPYEGNPVFAQKDMGADPKVIWHAPTKRWVMVTHSVAEERYCVNIFTSSDLKNWRYESNYLGDSVKLGKRIFLHECPGIEELKIEGEDKTAWVMWCANGEYSVGNFDGRVFRPLPRHERLSSLAKRGMSYYAAQAFQNAPDGRCVLIPWYRVESPEGCTFNQAMGLPTDLTLRCMPIGLRMARRPSRELEALRIGGAVPFDNFEGELVEMHVAAELRDDARVEMDIRGLKVVYDTASSELACGKERVPWPLTNGQLDLRMFLDRKGLECFSSDGLNCWPFCGAIPSPSSRKLSAKVFGAKDGAIFEAWKLRPMMNPAAQQAAVATYQRKNMKFEKGEK